MIGGMTKNFREMPTQLKVLVILDLFTPIIAFLSILLADWDVDGKTMLG